MEVRDLFESPSIERSRVRRWRILAVLCISLVIVVMGNVALNIALPRITVHLDASFTSLQWMVDAYALLFAALLLFAGALGDRFGRKGALQGGLVVYGLASLGAAFATQSWQVIAARAVMGVAAAFIMPGTLSILAVVFPPHERPRAIAIWAGVAGASVAVGMLWSGLLLERYWWGSVFLTNVPIVGLALVLGAFLLPKSRDPLQAHLDRGGALLSVAMLGTLLYGLIEGPVKDWTGIEILGSFAASAAFFTLFVWWERRVDDPMLDLSFFDDPRFTVGCVVILVAFMCLFSTYFLLTQYLQEVRGDAPLQAGIHTIPAGVAQLTTAPLSARLVERRGYRPILAAGLVSVAAGVLLLSFLTVSSPIWLLISGLVLLGIGVGTATPPATGAIIAALPLRKAGVGSAVNDTTRELGAALGIALLGSVLTSRFRSGLATAVRQLPPDLRRAAERGIGPALQVAHDPRVAQLSPHLTTTARTAFTSGFHLAGIVATAIAALGALVVLRAMPRELRPPDQPEHVADTDGRGPSHPRARRAPDNTNHN